MATHDIVVTVDFERVRASEGGAAPFDLTSLVKKIPSAQVVSGDPTISVQVRVADAYLNHLRSALAPYCVFDEYSELDLY